MNDETTMKQYVLIEAGPEDVWASLTDPDRMKQWLCDDAEVVAEVGGAYAFSGKTVFLGGDGQKITAIEPNKLLAFQWPLGEVLSTVRYELEAHLDMTRVVVHHRGYGDFANWQIFDLWRYMLGQLKYFTEHGGSPLRADFSKVERGFIEWSILVPTTTERAFDVIAKAEHLKNWMAPKVTVVAGVGGSVDLHWGTGPAEIYEYEEGKLLTYDFGENTRVRWTVKGEGVNARITMVHSGFAKEKDTPEDLFYGWAAYMIHIAVYALSGKPLAEWGMWDANG